MLDHRHPAAETAVGLGEFEADVSAPEHHQVFGHTIEFEHLDVGQRPGVGQPGNGRNRARRPQIQEDLLAR